MRDAATSPLVQEYDELVESLSLQLDVYKQKLAFLEEKALPIVKENEELTKLLNSEFENKLKVILETTRFSLAESEAVVNLRKQLVLCVGEKENAIHLYQTCLKAYEKLQSEMKNNSNENHDFAGKLAESKLENLDTRLQVMTLAKQQLEEQLTEYRADNEKLKSSVVKYHGALQQAKENVTVLQQRLDRLVQEHALVTATLECVTSSRDELEKALDEYTAKMSALEQGKKEAHEKIEEALDIVNTAIQERDKLLNRETQLQQEVDRLQLSLEHTIEGAGKRVCEAVEAARQEAEKTEAELKTKVEHLEKDLEIKIKKLKIVTAKCEKLEKTITGKLDKEKIKLIRGSETEIVILGNQIESVQREAEMLRAQLTKELKEKQETEDRAEALSLKCRQLLVEKSEEKGRWEEQLKFLKEEKERRLSEMNRRTSAFQTQVYELDMELRRVRGELHHLKETCRCEELQHDLRAIEELRVKQVTELSQHLDSYMKMEEKCKTKVKETVQQFAERMQEVIQKKKQVKLLNKQLRTELTETKGRLTMLYKESTGMQK